ncbi:MAG: energy transducer TonB [Desulfoprunum sp.]|uniref:energy transducer TonB n=1 Tax=Desulfoprunum sp. TaxID=2020866 RepID=UPI003C7259DC
MSSNNDWKLPLNLAIGFHILVALSTILFPLIFKSKPEFVDIYSVNLVNMEEPAAPSAPPPAATPAKTQSQPPPAPTPPKVIEKTEAAVKIPPKEAVPVAAEQPAEVTPPAPLKAISLKPLKRKVKKEVPPDNTVQREAEKREREIERQKRQQLAESLRAEQDAAEEAQLAAEVAEAERKLMEQTRQRLSQIRSSIQSSSSSTATSASATSSSSTTQGGESNSALDAQYYAAVAARIQPFFQLPEIKTFDPALVTIVVITINQSGEVADTQIESSSGDALYDQFVLKSIEAANPLPPIPPALRKQRIEMGLKFSPGGIH